MNEFKGTPGPWSAVDYCGRFDIQGGEYYEDANILDSEEVGAEVAEANASLIESAPDLLSSLRNLIHLHSCEQEGLSEGQPTPKQWLEAVNSAQQAINKALNQ